MELLYMGIFTLIFLILLELFGIRKVLDDINNKIGKKMKMKEQTDREKLSKGILPCCNKKVKKYLTGTKIPYCDKCDCYFTFEGVNNEFVIRNDNAKTLNNELWEEIKNNTTL